MTSGHKISDWGVVADSADLPRVLRPLSSKVYLNIHTLSNLSKRMNLLSFKINVEDQVEQGDMFIRKNTQIGK